MDKPATFVDDDSDDFIVRVAWMYHMDGLTQAQVATRLHVSRQTVGRILERARESGVVRVEIDPHRLISFGTARKVQEQFGLEEAIVVPSNEPGYDVTPRNDRLAMAAAVYIRRHLMPNTIVGIAWGDTVQRTLACLPSEALQGVTLATLSGGIEHITRRIMGDGAIAGHLVAIPTPLIVSTPQVAQTLLDEPAVRDVLDLASKAELTLTGIGNAAPGSSAARSGLVGDADVASFARKGAVGDMLGEWFDDRGRVVKVSTSERRIGVSLDDLKTMPTVVGIAGGRDKAQAIRGALRGGYLDVLVTDEEAAHELLR